MTQKTVLIDVADAQNIDGEVTLLTSVKDDNAKQSHENNNLSRSSGYNITIWNFDASNDLNVKLETVKDILGIGTCDTYAFSNIDSDEDLNDTNSKIAQSFTGDGGKIRSVQVHLKKTLVPEGKIRAKIYTHSGVFGTSSVPTGTALAVSQAIEANDLTTSYVAYEFFFEDIGTLEVNRQVLTDTTKFVMTIEYEDGDASNFVSVGADSGSGHSGNAARYTSSWTAVAGVDLSFFVNRTDVLEWLPLTAFIAVGTATGAIPEFHQFTGTEPYQALRVRAVKVASAVTNVDGLFQINERGD